jgi:hypothetical protein
MELADYYELATRAGSSLTADERASATYVLADMAVRRAERTGEGVAKSRALNWCTMANQLLQRARQLGRMPRPSDDVPSSLLHWVAYQRRTAGRHNGFQVAFLEAVPGWSWSPWDDDWDGREEDLRAFVHLHGRLPRTRSDEPDERHLAKWTARQRQLDAKDELPYARATAFRALVARLD